MSDELLSHQGRGYEHLLTYKKSLTIYRVTYDFAQRYIPHYDRTRDQMIQAARSCKQNIAEGSGFSTTLATNEIKLINVARSFLNELREDYIDYLLTRHSTRWEMSSVEYQAMRALVGRLNEDSQVYPYFEVRMGKPAVIANMMIALIDLTTWLLTRQLQRLGEDFLSEGALRRKLAESVASVEMTSGVRAVVAATVAAMLAVATVAVRTPSDALLSVVIVLTVLICP